jgi:hypothetical protein
MNIQNIQIAQGLFRTVEERLNSRRENISSQSDASLPQVNLPDATADSSKLSNEKDLMQVVYPPFFPIGNTQDILFIEGVKQQQTGENVKSKSSVTLEERKAIQQQESNKAASPDTGAVKAKAPQVKHEENPGVVLDFKI